MSALSKVLARYGVGGGGGGGGGFFLQQIALVDPANGNDATGTFGTLKAFKTIQAAVNAVPVYVPPDPPNQRRWWGILVSPGTYDEDLFVDVTNRKIAILGMGPFNIGLFDAGTWGPTNARNITVRVTASNVNNIRHSFVLGVLLPYAEANSSHIAYNTVPRVSGRILLDYPAVFTTVELYLTCVVFDQAATGTSIGLLSGGTTTNAYLHHCRFFSAITVPSMGIHKAERCRFDGAISVQTYSRLQDSIFNGNITVVTAPTQGLGSVQPYGFVSCDFAGLPAGVPITFTGPAAGLILDATTNYWFKTRGCLLGGAATKVITADLVP